MATKINVVEKTPGQHLGYSVTTERITFTYGEDELTVKVSAKERDEENTIDICLDDDGGLINGVAEKSRRYVPRWLSLPADMWTRKVTRRAKTGKPLWSR